MDATYWGRNNGLLVGMDALTGEVLYVKFIRHETNDDYLQCVNTVQLNGYNIGGVVVDGLRGLWNTLSAYPVQMCQYHQCAIVRRYLTNNPRLRASKALYELILTLTQSTASEFTIELAKWHQTWLSFINERSVNKQTGKSYYKHRRLRAAYRSLYNGLSHLFVYQQHNGMPNTNNRLEGMFSCLKNHLRAHNGMNQKKRKRFILGFLKAWGKPLQTKKEHPEECSNSLH